MMQAHSSSQGLSFHSWAPWSSRKGLGQEAVSAQGSVPLVWSWEGHLVPVTQSPYL